MQPWETFRQEKLSFMAKESRTVLDFGQSARTDRKYFVNIEYRTCDIDPTMRPDLVADICDLHMVADGSFDGVICIAVLEHVYDPFKAVAEIHRILRPGRLFFGFLPFLYPYHAKRGHYEDYYRFSRAGVAHLLKSFAGTQICPVWGPATTLINLLPSPFSRLQRMFFWADRWFGSKQVSGFYFFCRKPSP